MNGPPSDAQAKALEFVNSASSYVLLATIALLAWVASGVEFSNDNLRVAVDGVPDFVRGSSASPRWRSFRWCRRRGGRGNRTSRSKGASCCSAGAARG